VRGVSCAQLRRMVHHVGKVRGMPNEVLATSRAEQQIACLTRKHTKAFDGFLNQLAAHGCEALAYRLSGEQPIDHICVRHLSGSLRVVVAFESPRRAWILIVGQHDDQDPVLNVYAELYRLLGVEPQPDSGRDNHHAATRPRESRRYSATHSQTSLTAP
jgi:hypothetical protein